MGDYTQIAILEELREMKANQRALVDAFKSVAEGIKIMTEEIQLLRHQLSPVRPGMKSLEELKRRETGGPAK